MVEPGLVVTVWHYCVRVHGGCGCTGRSFANLGEYGLSLFLGLCPMKTHSWIRKGKKLEVYAEELCNRDENTRTGLSRRLRVE